MEYQVRIITTKRGYTNIIRGLKVFKSKALIEELINEKTCQFYNGLVFLKWNNPEKKKVIKQILMTLISHSNSYKVCVVEDEMINTYCNEVDCKNLPMPSIEFKIDDEDTIKKLENRIRKRGKRNGI